MNSSKLFIQSFVHGEIVIMLLEKNKKEKKRPRTTRGIQKNIMQSCFIVESMLHTLEQHFHNNGRRERREIEKK